MSEEAGGGDSTSVLDAPTSEAPESASVSPEAAPPQESSPWVNVDGTFAEAWWEKAPMPDGFEDKRNGFSKFKDVPAVLKAYGNLESQIGRKLRVPEPGADPKVVDAFRLENGIPLEPSRYEIEKPAELPEGVEWDEEGLEKFWKPAMHELNLTPNQVKGLIAKQLEYQSGVSQRVRAQMESQSAEWKQNALKSLKEEFGDKFDEKMSRARRAAAQASKEALGGQKIDDALANHPQTAKILAWAADLIGEDRLVTGDTRDQAATTMAQAMDIIKNPNNAEHEAYASRSHPEHMKVVAKVRSLLASAT